MVLNKYDLNYTEAFNFFVESLTGANKLSSEVLETIDLKNGSFFTLLPNDSDLTRLYEFKAGVVLPQNPEIPYSDGKGTYSFTPSIDGELAEILTILIKRTNDTYYIFDDILRDHEKKYADDPLNKYIYINNHQIYYILDNKIDSYEYIEQCLHESNAFWHSLFLLTTTKLNLAERQLSDATLKDICKHVSLMMVGAYDGEGYVFWQKNGCNYI